MQKGIIKEITGYQRNRMFVLMNIWIYLINNFEKFKLNNLFMKTTGSQLTGIH